MKKTGSSRVRSARRAHAKKQNSASQAQGTTLHLPSLINETLRKDWSRAASGPRIFPLSLMLGLATVSPPAKAACMALSGSITASPYTLVGNACIYSSVVVSNNSCTAPSVPRSRIRTPARASATTRAATPNEIHMKLWLMV